MGDTLALDTDLAARVRDVLDGIAERVSATAPELERWLRTAELSTAVVRLVDEIADEVGAAARFLAATTEATFFADRFGSTVSGEGWIAAMRADWADARNDLWAGLTDDVGSTGLEAGGFSLANALVPIDRPTWLQAAIPPDCRSFGPDAYYTGGGAVRGPDGRLYPIVVPHVLRGDDHYTIDADLPDDVPSAASLDGRDSGWHVVGYRTGVEQIHADVSGWWQGLAAVAFASGLPSGGQIDDGHLAAIELRLGGRPRFGGNPPTAGAGGSAALAAQSIEPHTGPVVDGRVPGRTASGRTRTMALPNPPSSPGVTARSNLPGNAASLAINGLQGVQVAMSLNDANSRAYEVVFEEHADGRIRSRIQSFALEPKRDAVIMSAWHLFVDDEGRLTQTPAKYQSGPTDDGDDDDDHTAVVAENPYDADYEVPVPNSAIDPG